MLSICLMSLSGFPSTSNKIRFVPFLDQADAIRGAQQTRGIVGGGL